MKKRHKKQRAILIALVVLLGIGVVGLTGKILDTEYGWIEKAKNLFKKPEVLAEDEETESEEADSSGNVLLRHIGFTKSSLYQGEERINLTLTPENANIKNLSWTVDNPAVNINVDNDGMGAIITVSNYFSPYATITVTEAYSGVTGTGKVYSYGKTGFDQGGTRQAETGLTGNYVASVKYDSTKFQKLTAPEVTANRNTSQLLNNPDVITANGTVVLNLAFQGSYAPLVRNYTIIDDNRTLYKVANPQAIYNAPPANGEYNTNVASYTITLEEGLNVFEIERVKLGENDSTTLLLGKIGVLYGEAVTGIELPDLEFYN